MGVLEGKAAVVTGGGRGIGRGHCLHLGANGAAKLRLEGLRLRAVGQPAGAQSLHNLSDLVFADFRAGER